MPLPAMTARPWTIGVVGDAHRLAERLRERRGQAEPLPGVVPEIGRGENTTDADHAGEPDGHAIVRPERPHELDERPDDRRRRAAHRGIDADGRREEVARLVHHRGLQVRAANVDRQRADHRAPLRLGRPFSREGTLHRGLPRIVTLHAVAGHETKVHLADGIAAPRVKETA